MISNDEKLINISYMVMKEANDMKNQIIEEAEKESSKALTEKELFFLENAYGHIQKSLEKIEKECNQEVSDAIILNKRSLLNRREELVESIFHTVKEGLKDYKAKGEYRDYLKLIIVKGLSKTGSDEVHIFADSDDVLLIRGIQAELDRVFELSESDYELLGGCLIQNKTKGLMYDYSFTGHLSEERSNFLEKYELPIK